MVKRVSPRDTAAPSESFLSANETMPLTGAATAASSPCAARIRPLVAERGGLDGQQLEIGTRCLFFRKRDFAGMIVLLFLVVVARVILAGMIVPFRFVIVELGSVVARFGLAGAPLPVRAGVSATRHECCGQYADY